MKKIIYEYQRLRIVHNARRRLSLSLHVFKHVIASRTAMLLYK